MADQPFCSIVIRAYNEEEHIGRLLAGIMEQTINDVEIIVVDSGSTDATLAIASRFPTKIIHIQPEEFTFGRSLNLGCSEARGKYLIFASAHVYPLYTNWIEALLEPFNDDSIALSYGKQRGTEITRYSEHRQFERMYPEESRIPQRHPLCNNANAAVRRKLWEQHPYDEGLSGLEDLEWATWAIERGYLLAYTADAEVIHVHEESPRQVFRRYKREAIALAQIRPEESFNLIDFIRLYFSNVQRDLQQAARDRMVSSVFGEVLWFRWMQFWGTYIGFRHAGPLTDEVIQAFYYPKDSKQTRIDEERNREAIDYSEAGQRHTKAGPHD
jgi:glycosyltransferase involved in cell wall biosynthesis